MNGDASQGGDGSISNVLIERKMVHGNGVGGGGSSGNTVTNNVLYDDHSFQRAITIDASVRTGFVADVNSGMDRYGVDGDNTVIDLAARQPEGYGANSFNAVPSDHFASPGSDYHLIPASPAVDAGTTIGAPPDDLAGGTHPVGVGVDVRVYEIRLLECGDGDVDDGEQCGEPGLGCSDPCIGCSQCVCAQIPVMPGKSSVPSSKVSLQKPKPAVDAKGLSLNPVYDCGSMYANGSDPPAYTAVATRATANTAVIRQCSKLICSPPIMSKRLVNSSLNERTIDTQNVRSAIFLRRSSASEKPVYADLVGRPIVAPCRSIDRVVRAPRLFSFLLRWVSSLDHES